MSAFPNPAPDQFPGVQKDIYYRLVTEIPYAPFYVIRDEDVTSKIQSNLGLATAKPVAGKIGLVGKVLMPLWDAQDPDAAGPLLNFTLTVQIHENPRLNFGATGTRKSAEVFAMDILKALHQFNLLGVCGGIYSEKNAIAPSREKDFVAAGLVTYDVTVKALYPLTPPNRVVTATISSPAQTVTLTPNTAGASIYYTIDGTTPCAANDAAILYAAPFTVPSGTLLRVACFKAGLQGSDIDQVTIT